jgi:hypothetical protein
MKHKFLFSVVAAAALSACGGGGDDAPAPGGTTPINVNVSGTAAVGAAIAGATVNVKCATGSGSATTGADGSFSLTVQNAVRPCVLEVAAPGGGTLHSLIASGTGTDVVANITPLSELMVATLAGGSAADFYSTFDSAAQAKVTTDGVTGARDAVIVALSGVVDLTGVDPIQDSLQAANGSTAGNELDQKLDALGDALSAAQVSLADVSAAIAANPSAPAPVQTILQPAATSCAGLRTGAYRLVELTSNLSEVVQIDAAAMTFTNADGSSEPIFDQGNCRFTVTEDANPGVLTVSKSGVAVVRDGGGGTLGKAMLLLPEQSMPVSELAGTWHALGFERFGGPLQTVAATMTIDATGKIVAGSDCDGLQACVAWPDDEVGQSFTASTSGGFELFDGDSATRMFAFKTADGQTSLVFMHADGFVFATRNQARPLPAVGLLRTIWDTSINNAGILSMPLSMTTEVLSVDSVAGTYSRQRSSDLRIDYWNANQPRAGLGHRVANSSTINGVAQTHPLVLGMILPGTGVSLGATLNPANAFFSLVVEQ